MIVKAIVREDTNDKVKALNSSRQRMSMVGHLFTHCMFLATLMCHKKVEIMFGGSGLGSKKMSNI